MFAPRYFAGRYFPRRYFPRGSNTSAGVGSGITEAHRLAYAVVPTFQDMGEVQRFLQRAFDDMARAMNSVRSVADGGTGIAALDRGEILAGSETANAYTRVKGNQQGVRKVLVSIGNGIDAGIPFWDVLQTGDIPSVGAGTNVIDTALDTVLVSSGASVITP